MKTHPYTYFIETLNNGKFRVRVKSENTDYQYIKEIQKGDQRDWYYEYQLTTSEESATKFPSSEAAKKATNVFDVKNVKPFVVCSEEYRPS